MLSIQVYDTYTDLSSLLSEREVRGRGKGQYGSSGGDVFRGARTFNGTFNGHESVVRGMEEGRRGDKFTYNCI